MRLTLVKSSKKLTSTSLFLHTPILFIFLKLLLEDKYIKFDPYSNTKKKKCTSADKQVFVWQRETKNMPIFAHRNTVVTYSDWQVIP